MTVNGTEQRVYGILSSNCKINLQRFVIVLGDTVLNPDETTGSLIYGGELQVRQCGQTYTGFLTLLYGNEALIEVRLCNKEDDRFVIESYGSANATYNMGLWFLKSNIIGTELSHSWVQLNSVSAGVMMPYVKVSAKVQGWSFRESTMYQATDITCCKACPTCECADCIPIADNKFRVTTATQVMYGNGYVDLTIKNYYGNRLLNFGCIILEYTIVRCHSIEYWAYYDPTLTDETIEIAYQEDDDSWTVLYTGMSSEVGERT